MPVISHPNLPSLERLESSGLVLNDGLSINESDRRNLHIGLLNLMPDAAFKATERQFVSMLASNKEFLIQSGNSCNHESKVWHRKANARRKGMGYF